MTNYYRHCKLIYQNINVFWKHLLGTEQTELIINHVDHNGQKLCFQKNIHTPPI